MAVKHANPCGVGSASSVYDAYMKAYEADPVSIFGGIVVANRGIDAPTAEEINKIFVEIVVAPSYTKEALDILKRKKNIRILLLEDIASELPAGLMDSKKVLGGLLLQEIDNQLLPDMSQLKVVTEKKPAQEEMDDLIFAWKIVKHTKSNGIAIAKNKQSLGIGPGQVNRIWAVEHAIHRSGDKVKGAVLASDAFFPFSDCVEAAAKAGISAIIQPGGSIRDQESIDACNKYGISMIFTGMRHLNIKYMSYHIPMHPGNLYRLQYVLNMILQIKLIRLTGGKAMKILVVGGGGREHALVWKISHSPKVKDILPRQRRHIDWQSALI